MVDRRSPSSPPLPPGVEDPSTAEPQWPDFVRAAWPRVPARSRVIVVARLGRYSPRSTYADLGRLLDRHPYRVRVIEGETLGRLLNAERVTNGRRNQDIRQAAWAMLASTDPALTGATCARQIDTLWRGLGSTRERRILAAILALRPGAPTSANHIAGPRARQLDTARTGAYLQQLADVGLLNGPIDASATSSLHGDRRYILPTPCASLLRAVLPPWILSEQDCDKVRANDSRPPRLPGPT